MMKKHYYLFAFFSAIMLGGTCSANTPDPEKLPEGVWLDDKTGLMWQMCPAGQDFNKETVSCEGSVHMRPYSRAVKAAYRDKTGGYRDWRLPTHSDLLAFRDNALRGSPEDKKKNPQISPIYLASDSVYPNVFWSSETLIFGRKRYVSKACFPYVSGIGACGNSYMGRGKDPLFGSGNIGEGWVVPTIFVRDGKTNEVWDAALLSVGIDRAGK